MFRDSVDGVKEVMGNSSTEPVIYQEGRYLWGEVITKIGNATFRIDRDAPDRNDPAQRLPAYLQLNIEYSDALKQAMSEEDRGKEDYVPETGEFWVGNLRCGSAMSVDSSPYRITVKLLEDGQEIARRQYVIGVLSNSACAEGGGEDKPSGGPPPTRP
jgi:hypothetical protein